MERRRIKNFTLTNRISELDALSGKTEDIAEKWELPGSLAMNLNLVMEEAVTNIINYAFNDSGEHKIKISLSLGKNILTVRIKDDGIYFDPTSREPPDISLPATERPVGGLGIFLISQIMDTVHYSREKNLNVLTLTKKI
jgi:anti-sigma regulatory factor (Ser/Thr protein kinase)